MNGRRTLLTAMTLAVSLAWAGDAMPQVLEVKPQLRPQLKCNIWAYSLWGSNPWSGGPYFDSIPNGASLNLPSSRRVQVGGSVWNQGGSDSGPFQVSMNITNNGQSLSLPSPTWELSLGIGESSRIPDFNVPLQEGAVERYGGRWLAATNEIAVSVTVDIGNTVTERNETDNTCNYQFTIS